MNSYFDNLTAHNLESRPQTLRPRIGSRFENQSSVQSNSLENEIDFASDQNEIIAPTIDDSPATPATGDRTREPSHDRLLRRQVDLLHSKVMAFSGNQTQPDTAPPNNFPKILNVETNVETPPGLPLESKEDSQLSPPQIGVSEIDKPKTEIHHREHASHQKTVVHHHHETATIRQAEAPTPIVDQTISQSDTNGLELPIPLIVEKQLPQFVSSNVPPTPVVSPVKSTPTNSTPKNQSIAPQIFVEPNQSKSNQPQHTVTVTIGRIEVRGPQKPATPAPTNPKTPQPKIMTLDDYVQKRSGGVR